MSVAKVRQACESVVTINVTPFGADGEIDTDAYAALVDRCVAAGIDVVTANGNTGEFYALDHAEQAVATLTVEANAGRAVVLAGVGHSAREAAAEAVAAGAAGADGVMVHQPVHPYQSTDGWVDHHRLISDAVPDLGGSATCAVPSVPTRSAGSSTPAPTSSVSNTPSPTRSRWPI